jgi:hypothetical protein
MGIKLDTLLTETNNIDSQEASLVTKNTTEIPKSIPDIDAILNEWTWRCDKGYPDFNNPSDMYKLQEVLIELGIVDAGLTNNQFFDDYRKCLDKKLELKQRTKLVNGIQKLLKETVGEYGAKYGTSGYKKIPAYVVETLMDLSSNSKDLVIINNAVSLADSIISKFAAITPGMVDRGDKFESIRKHAVKLIDTNYNIQKYFPDNWCPGDLYIFLNSDAAAHAKSTTTLNIGDDSLNRCFYGTDNTKGDIIAVSLKMQKAQAGKGTTFVKNVVIQDVTPKDKLGKDKSNQQIIKFRDIVRRLKIYYIDSDAWKTDPKILDKVRKSIIGLSRHFNINAPVKTTETELLVTFLSKPKNKTLIRNGIDTVNNQFSTSINTANTCKQAYTRFVKDLKSMNIQKVTGEFSKFLKDMEANNKKKNNGELNQTDLQTLLARKAAAYDLASTLIEKWTETTKKVSPAFEKYLGKVKNPFVAVTLFAVAQHGLNPNFYKAIGNNNASKASIHEFPSNSTVDESKSTENLKVVDSPSEAGFSIEYDLTINNNKYHTILSFRFAKSEIRIEVEKLAEM